MKKVLLTAVIASMLILPLGNVALADHEQTSQPQAPAADYVAGGVPAQTDLVQSMSPALHGVVLAMLNHGAEDFSPADTALTWESLYNMLSLYGQLDNRSEYEDDWLVLPAETAMDYAAALNVNLAQLGPMPAELADRLVYSAGDDSYRVACGSDDLVEFQVRQSAETGGRLSLSGALVSRADGAELAQFQAQLQTQDNMFGCVITSLRVS